FPPSSPALSATSRSATRGRVLARELRRRAFLSLLLTVEPRLPAPRALQIVAHVYAQFPEPLRFQLDQIAVLEAAQSSMVGARGEKIARLQRVDRGHPLDTAGNLVSHVAGIEVLLERPVHPQPDLESVRVDDLVGGDDVRPDRCERVTRLHLVERVAAGR